MQTPLIGKRVSFLSENLVKKSYPRVMNAVAETRYWRVGYEFLIWTEQTHLLNLTWPCPVWMNGLSPWLPSLAELLSWLFGAGWGWGGISLCPSSPLPPLLFFLIFCFIKFCSGMGNVLKSLRAFPGLDFFFAWLLPHPDFWVGNVSFAVLNSSNKSVMENQLYFQLE